MMSFLIIVSFDYVQVSWSIHEGSREAGGLPYPAVPLLKSLIPLTAFLVLLQGIANLIRDIIVLRHPDRPDVAEAHPDHAQGF